MDSAVVGEQQVLGQVRRAYASAEANHTVGRTLHELSQRALAVGKRVHSETGIAAAGASVVSVALDTAEKKVGSLAGRRAVVVGAGSMGALAAKLDEDPVTALTGGRPLPDYQPEDRKK